MQRATVLAQLTEYVSQQVLEDRSANLEETTPLLEWGILNSLEVIRLLSYINEQFGFHVSPDQIVAGNFVNLGAITDLVITTAAQGSSPQKS